MSFQFDNDSGFGGGDVFDTGTQVMQFNEWAGRWFVTHAMLVTQTKRWLRLTMPSQTPVHNEAFFELGYFWSGPLTAIPDGLFEAGSIRPETVRPRNDRRGLGEGLSRLRTGPSFARLHGRRMAEADPTGDLLAGTRAWQTLEREWWDAPSQAGAFWLNEGSPAEAGVFRLLEQEEWSLADVVKSTSGFTLEEFIRGE